jgi:HEPN domain-containing protein
MTEREKAVRKFRRAAEQRWLTAHWILSESEYYLDAVYLAGYAVECSLKALIFRRTSNRAFEKMYEEVTSGKKAHDFEFLKGLLKRPAINLVFPKEVMEPFRRVASWSTDLRYESGILEYDEANEFLDAVTVIRTWVERLLR